MGKGTTRHWTLREFIVEGDRIVPTTVKSNPGNRLFRSSDRRSVDFANYLVTNDVLGKLRGAGNEESVDTFSFELTRDHLNSFESDARLRGIGDVVRAFDDNPGGPAHAKLCTALAPQAQSFRPATSYIDLELRRAPDAIITVPLTATATRNWGLKTFLAAGQTLYVGYSRDREGVRTR